jgi:hypothetical protein
MAYGNIASKDDLISRIKWDLMRNAKKKGVPLTSDNTLEQMFETLLESIFKKYGVSTVILVDEYDAPVTSHISDKEFSLAIRDVLHNFYQSINTNIDFIHFILVTGITRLAMPPLDSVTNNFKDISLLPEFSGICGFTQSELDSYFEDRFEETLEIIKTKDKLPLNADVGDLMTKILEWYDGYNWLGNEHVLNPYTILNFFDEKQFKSFWPSTGQPSNLIAIIREHPLDFTQLNLQTIPTRQIRSTDLSDLTIESVLFHSGYLTIDGNTTITTIKNLKKFDEDAFTFKTPNKEISFNSKVSIIKSFFKIKDRNLADLTKNLPIALLNKNSDEIVRMVHNLLISLSFPQHQAYLQDAHSRNLDSEHIFHAILYVSLLSAGFNVLGETSRGKGRSDITLFLQNNVCVVIELKYCTSSELYRRCVVNTNHKKNRAYKKAKEKARKMRREKELSASLDSAEDQMRNNDSIGSYRATQHTVICMALAIRGHTEVAVRFVDI